VSEWNTVPLSDIAESVDYGVTASATQQPIGPKFLRITDIQNGAVDWDKVPWCECDARSASDARLKAGDIVFARTGATTGKSFLIRECPTDAVFASYLIRVRLSDAAEPRFVRHFFQTPLYWAQITKGTRGVAQPGVNATTLKSLRIPLPRLEEQRRIAELLDRAEALRAKGRAALVRLDTLTPAIFLDMFGDPATNPKGWPIRRVSDYVAEFQGGKSIEAEVGENVITRNRVLKVSAVTGMKYLAEQSKPLPDSYEPLEEHFVRRGDLLFSRANTTELVGAVAYVDQTPPRLLLPDKLWRFVWREPADVEPLFVWALFQTPIMRYEIGRRATGTSGSMKNISQEKVLGIHTIFPPSVAQREFAGRVTKVEKLKATYRVCVSELDALFVSLQYRAFRGEL
jgi:type I restriction enzyme S subunit